MKRFTTYISSLLLLSSAMISCQRDDDFYFKEEAVSVVLNGFNGSDAPLIMSFDTAVAKNTFYMGNFKHTEKFTFPAGKDSAKFTIRDTASGTIAYEQYIKRGNYSVPVTLIWAGNKAIVKPEMPAPKEGFRQTCFLFLPVISNATEDMDMVFYKRADYYENNQLKKGVPEEIARITVKPYTFSAFLDIPIFQMGRFEKDGVIYIMNPDLKYYKAGTNVNYYDGLDVVMPSNWAAPMTYNTRPVILGIQEWGSKDTKYIESFQQLQF